MSGEAELSDADVFGGGELSDDDVFGAAAAPAAPTLAPRIGAGYAGAHASWVNTPPDELARAYAPRTPAPPPGPSTPLPSLEQLRADWADDPEAGSVLPFAGDASKGTLRLAVPNSLRAMGRGGLDLLMGPRTGEVTPEATGLLFGQALGGLPPFAGRMPFVTRAPAPASAPSTPPVVPPAPPGVAMPPDLFAPSGGGPRPTLAPEFGPSAGSVAQPPPPGPQPQSAPAPAPTTTLTMSPLDAAIQETLARPPAAPAAPRTVQPGEPIPWEAFGRPDPNAPPPATLAPPIVPPGQMPTPPTANPEPTAAPPPQTGAAAPPAPAAPQSASPGAGPQAAAPVPGDAPPASALPTTPEIQSAMGNLRDMLDDPRTAAQIQAEREEAPAPIEASPADPPPIPLPSPGRPPLTPEAIADAAGQTAENPSPGQAAAGNYQKGRVRIGGEHISIETALGATRSGVGADGKPWSVDMPADYGQILGTKGADGDPVDVYLGPDAHQAPNHPVFVVDQIDPATGKFDEHKTLIGYPSREAALGAYSRAFNDGSGPDRIGAATEMRWPEFRAWLRGGGGQKGAVAYRSPAEQGAERDRIAASERRAVEADVRAFVATTKVAGFTDAMVREAVDLAHAPSGSNPAMAVPEAVAEVVSRHASAALDAVEHAAAEAGIPLPFTLEPTENGLFPVAAPPHSESPAGGQPDQGAAEPRPAERPAVSGPGGGADESVPEAGRAAPEGAGEPGGGRPDIGAGEGGPAPEGVTPEAPIAPEAPPTQVSAVPPAAEEARDGRPDDVADGGAEAPPQRGPEPRGQPEGGEAAGPVDGSPAADDGPPAPDRPARPPVPRVRAGRPAVRDDERADGPGDAPAGRGGAGGEGVEPLGAGDRGAPAAPSRPNFHIADPDALIGGTPKVRFARNKAAILALQAIEEENRPPTQDELEAMAAYTGWGSFGQELFNGSWEHPRPKDGWQAEDKWLREQLGEADWRSAQRTIINAHYTDPPTVQAMWRMVERMGFTGGRVLEPSMGVGNFFGMMPRDIMDRSELTGIELDSLTGRMAKILYPQANIQIKAYQDSKTPDGFYDLVIGNWPFAKDGPADRRYDKLNPSLHDYFFLKAMDQTREGGLVVGITSAGTMDKQGRAARLKLADAADVVGAFRLPSGAFERYAGTGVVTDIILLQKRPAGQAMSDDTRRWIETGEAQVKGGEIRRNEYYADHPDHVLGTFAYGHGTTYGRAGMTVERPDDLMARLTALHEKVPEGIYHPKKRVKEERFITNNTTQRQNAVVVEGGELYQVQGERLALLADRARGLKVKDAKKAAERAAQVRKLVGVREAYAELIDAERAGAENTEQLRDKLNKQYQAFHKAHGPIRGSEGHGILDAVEDPFAPALAALERPDGTPAQILTEAVTRGNKVGANPTISEAYVLARNESMILDLERVAELAKRPRAEVERALLDAKAIYRTPGGGFEAGDVYLSGNVRLKLREAQDAVERGEPMQASVKALEEVQPKDVPYFQIDAKMGATWVGEDTYRAFLKDMLGLTDDEAGTVQVRFKRGRWQVGFTDPRLMGRPEATTTRGSPNYRFDKLVMAAMGNIAPVIRYRDPDTKSMVVDAAATEEVNAKIAALREEFSVWAWRDPLRRVQLERAYNDTMNAIGKPKYDGSFLDMSGMALRRGEDPFALRQHQQDAIWRGVSQGRGLFAHEVGTGKTFTMGGIAVEGRRFGVHKKPLVFAHNANSAAVAREMQEMYPGGKFLYIDNLAPADIKATLYRIANDDWDAVIMPHSLIDRIALTRETLEDLMRDEIEALENEAIEAAEADNVSLTVADMDDEKKMGNLRSVTAKNLVKQRQAIIKKIDDMANRASREGAIPFEELGVDAILVDEAHEFKKPSISTRMRLKGLNVATSDRSLALQFLTGYVRGQRDGKGTYLFTGTPITNSLVEIFNMMRFVMQDRMDRDGIGDWDSWFASFADALADVELTASGGYETVTRLSAFVNTDELVKMASEFVDVVQASDMPEFKPRETKSGKTLASENLTAAERAELTEGRSERPEGRPYKKVITDVGEMSFAQRRIFEHLKQLASDFRNATGRQRYLWMKEGDPRSPVIVETNAANASLDARLYDPAAGDDSGSKVNRAVARILTHYNEHPLATQAVFVDRGYSKPKSWDQSGLPADELPPVLVQDMVAKLVAAGIPRGEIAIVAGGTSAEKKKQIADQMNAGTIRVVIGQSQTLGVGVNMQVNLRAMHHLDAPWRPGDLEQRNGRGERQGNKWNTVLEYRYITEGIDGRRWQVLSAKDRFIKQFIRAFNDDSGKRIGALEGDAAEISDEETDILDTLSKAAGDARVQRRAKLKADVDRLERRERQHTYGIADAHERIKVLRNSIPDAEKYIEEWTAGLATWDEGRARAKKAAEAAKDDKVWNEAEILGQKYWTGDTIAAALEQAAKTKLKYSQRERIGTINGLPLYRRGWLGDGSLLALAPKEGEREIDLHGASVAALSGAMTAVRNGIVRQQEKITEAKAAIPRLEASAKEEFPQAQKLERSKQQLADLEADLQANPVPPPPWLRNGAMVDTAIFVDGEERVVRGHRVSDDYYVITDEGAVPYLEVKDENGQPVFEEHEPPAKVEEGKTAQAAPAPPAPQLSAGWDVADGGTIQAQENWQPQPEVILSLAEALRSMTGGRATVRFINHSFRSRAVQPNAPEDAVADGMVLGPLIVASLNWRLPWVLHHETVHALRNLGIVGKGEWRVLERAAESGDWVGEFHIEERYPFVDEATKIEEAIADKFGQWSTMGVRQPKGAVGRAWNRVKTFVQRTGNALLGHGYLTADDVFRKIKAGALGARPTGSEGPTKGPRTVDEALAALGFFETFDEVPSTLADVLAHARFAMAPTAPGATAGAVTSFATPAPTRLDDQLYRYQDRHIDTKRTLEAIEKAGGTITDQSDPRLAEELYHNRVAKRLKDFRNHEVAPLLRRMEELKVTLPALEEYLWARHAEERNRQIAKIDPARPDGGSGMTDAEAQRILDSYRTNPGNPLSPPTPEGANLAAAASYVDQIAAGTRFAWVGYGLDDAKSVRRMMDAYQHYVPLQREDMQEPEELTKLETGQGFSTKGQSARRALGSDKAAVDILGNLLQQRERAIIRGEKNRVANALIDLALDNPNPDFWKVNRPPMIRYLDKSAGLVRSMVDPEYKNRPEVVVARSLDNNGDVRERALIFNKRDPRALRMAMAIKNLDIDELNHVLSRFAIATRLIARLNTQYNPVFGVVNVVRDTQEAMVNLASTPIPTKQLKVAAGVPIAMATIMRSLRRERRNATPLGTRWDDAWEEFQKEGGPTGFRDLFTTAEARTGQLEKDLARLGETRNKRLLKAPYRWLRDMLSDFNEALENATRLSAYVAAKDAGLSRQRAASLAKNLTVNFNRKGAETWLGSLFAFFNANVQGTARMLETLASKAGKPIIVGGLLLGMAQQAVLVRAGFDEKEIKTLSFILENNFVIPTGGKGYAKIPMPLGFKALPNIGRVTMDLLLTGGEDAGEKLKGLVGTVAGSFNPLGSSGMSMQLIAPTVADPLAAVAENVDWTGRELAIPNRNNLDPSPGYTRSRAGDTDASKWLAQQINRIGGTEWTPGYVSPTPTQIDYLAGQYAGGIGREGMNAMRTVDSLAKGEKPDLARIPLVGRFVGSANTAAATRSVFYENLKKLYEHARIIKGMAQSGGDVPGYVARYPEARLAIHAGPRIAAPHDAVERSIVKLRQQQRQAKAAGADKERLQAIEQAMTDMMANFNAQVRAARQAQPGGAAAR